MRLHDDAVDEVLLGQLQDVLDGDDLIVVGIKRMAAVAKAVLGSTAQRVLTGASCPVLSVRAEDE